MIRFALLGNQVRLTCALLAGRLPVLRTDLCMRVDTVLHPGPDGDSLRRRMEAQTGDT